MRREGTWLSSRRLQLILLGLVLNLGAPSRTVQAIVLPRVGPGVDASSGDVPAFVPPASLLAPPGQGGGVYSGTSLPRPAGPQRRPQPVPRMSLPRLFRGLREALRGGAPFRREGNEAKYRSRPQVGIEISNGLAIALSALSAVFVGASLPMLWSAPAGLSESFWLTRIVIVRALAFVYFVAFAVAFSQNTALLGDKGLLPASVYLERLRESPSFPSSGGLTWRVFNKYPTWLWLAPKGRMDESLRLTAAVGMLMSGAVLLNGGSNCFVQATLWLLYHSIVTVGQRWYGFGWESQLLETGFISILMVPLFSLSALPAGAAMPWVALWALRWLCFRIMIGAGMIKIRGDACWRDLTAMCYHYETQPGSGLSDA
jgi:hypothetical protein